MVIQLENYFTFCSVTKNWYMSQSFCLISVTIFHHFLFLCLSLSSSVDTVTLCTHTDPHAHALFSPHTLLQLSIFTNPITYTNAASYPLNSNIVNFYAEKTMCSYKAQNLPHCCRLVQFIFTWQASSQSLSQTCGGFSSLQKNTNAQILICKHIPTPNTHIHT